MRLWCYFVAVHGCCFSPLVCSLRFSNLKSIFSFSGTLFLAEVHIYCLHWTTKLYQVWESDFFEHRIFFLDSSSSFSPSLFSYTICFCEMFSYTALDFLKQLYIYNMIKKNIKKKWHIFSRSSSLNISLYLCRHWYAFIILNMSLEMKKRKTHHCSHFVKF